MRIVDGHAACHLRVLQNDITNKLPKQIDNYDKELNTNEMKYKSVKNIAKWWLIKYDKI